MPSACSFSVAEYKSSRLFPSGLLSEEDRRQRLPLLGHIEEGVSTDLSFFTESPSWLSTESLCFNQPTDLLRLNHVGIWDVMQIITVTVSSPAHSIYLIVPTDLVLPVVEDIPLRFSISTGTFIVPHSIE